MNLLKRVKRKIAILVKTISNPKRELRHLICEKKSVSAAINKISSMEYSSLNDKTSCIIFTKDRPLQLYALLKSLSLKLKDLDELHIIYNAQNSDFKIAYDEVFNSFQNKISETHNDESGFKDTLLKVVSKISSDRIFFLVDDILFIRELDLNRLTEINPREIIFSLRLGENIKYCYMLDKPQKLPGDFKKTSEFGEWTWSQGKYDWKYPLSVDGHIFFRKDILEMIKAIEFKAPNTLESRLQSYNRYFLKKRGKCALKPSIFNNPCNKVQTEIPCNRFGQLTSAQLLEKWNEGMEIDVYKFFDIKNRGVHEEKELQFVKRA